MKVADLVAELRFEADTSGLKQVQEGTAAAGAGTIALGGIIASGITKLADMGVQALKTAAAFAVDLVTSFVDTGDELGKVSRQIGVTTDDLQGLRFAAERSGVSNASLEKGLKALQLGLLDAELKGTGPFAEALEALGLGLDTVKDLTTVEQLKLYADALNTVESESRRTAIAAKLFGARAGPELKTLLENGSAGIEELLARADELGGIIPPEGIASAERLADAFTDLNTLGKGAANTVGGAFAPAVDEAVRAITDWVSNNDDFIQQELPLLIEEAADAARELVPRIIQVVKQIASMVKIVVLVEEKTGIFSRTIAILKAPITLVTTAMGFFRDVGLEIVDVILRLAEAIPGLSASAKELRETLALFKDTEVKVEVSEETTKKLKEEEDAFKKAAAADEKAKKVVGGLEVAAPRRKRSRVRVLAEKLEDKEKLSRAERREARDLGLDVPRRKGGRGKKKKEPEAITGIPELDAALAGLDEDPDERGVQAAGGGASAGTATTINRIDQSFSSTTSLSVTIDGADFDLNDPEGSATRILEAVEDKLAERDRQSADHFRSVIDI